MGPLKLHRSPSSKGHKHEKRRDEGHRHCLHVEDVDCGIRHMLAGREQGAATLSGQSPT